MTSREQSPPLDPINVTIFVGLPVLALVLVPAWGAYHGYSAAQWLWAVAFLYLNGMSITGGYHRLWSHKAYEAHPLLKWCYALWGAGALQNSILIWSADHRRHHRHVDDNERDPYSAGRGLWFSHMGWMLRKYNANEADFRNVRDLQEDRVVMFQHRHYVALTVFMNVGLPLLVGLMLGDIIGTLLLVGLLRLVINHHFTFFINSLAHFWGRRPYTEANSARDNDFLAFLTYGEGYHNYHHLFQRDYRNGIRWWHWDPTKWMINLCSRIGLARSLQRAPNFRIQRALLDTQFRRARNQLELARGAEGLRALVEREYQLFTESINTWSSLQSQWYEGKKTALGDALGEHKQKLQDSWEKTALRTRIKEIEHSLGMQRKRLELLMAQMRVQAQTA